MEKIPKNLNMVKLSLKTITPMKVATIGSVVASTAALLGLTNLSPWV